MARQCPDRTNRGYSSGAARARVAQVGNLPTVAEEDNETDDPIEGIARLASTLSLEQWDEVRDLLDVEGDF